MSIVDGNKQSVSEIATALGFSTDEITEEVLTQTVTEIIAKNEKLVKKILKGNKGPIQALVGQVLKQTGRKGDPMKIKELIEMQLIK